MHELYVEQVKQALWGRVGAGGTPARSASAAAGAASVAGDAVCASMGPGTSGFRMNAGMTCW